MDPTREQIYELLNSLSESMFQEVVFRLEAPTEHFPAANAPRAERAMALIKYCENQTAAGLAAILQVLRERFPFVLSRLQVH
ncbi:hypothetical protein [Haliangium sp. UPWRP_2]|uniref:hypothetical protein n=1 Tax=Haliangium sp. UPWRP_2 TaxID=1931276 RepID=UPI000B538F03|nr:hypothetical protein [Haliangium sp. UPWRP_2]PSM31866.1 hypothetical protein BVG81_003135 [Haliangium sp. UPWRP_2]